MNDEDMTRKLVNSQLAQTAAIVDVTGVLRETNARQERHITVAEKQLLQGQAIANSTEKIAVQNERELHAIGGSLTTIKDEQGKARDRELERDKHVFSALDEIKRTVASKFVDESTVVKLWDRFANAKLSMRVLVSILLIAAALGGWLRSLLLDVIK